MPKKKQAVPKNEQGRAPFILRFDVELYTRLKALAEEAGVSVNQLMEGASQWLVKNAKVGEPILNGEGNVVGYEARAGCIWAGETEEEREMSGNSNTSGVWMSLDFTTRRFVREYV